MKSYIKDSLAHDYLREGKSVLLRAIGLMRVNTAVFAITTRCNQQCAVCDFGKNYLMEHKDLSIASIVKVLAHPVCQKVAYIGITGGEPFVYPEILDLRNMLYDKQNQAHVTISSNGTMTDEIIRYFSKKDITNKTFLELSLWGIKKHDDMSGGQGALARIKKTLKALRTYCINLDVRIKFTITPQNYQDLFDVIAFCEEQKMPLILKLVENVEAHQNMASYKKNQHNPMFYFTSIQKKQVVQGLRECQSAQVIFNKRHVQAMIDSLEGRTIHRPCFADNKSIFVAQDKKIYFCRMFAPIAEIDGINNQGLNCLYQKRVSHDRNVCKACVSVFRSIM